MMKEIIPRNGKVIRLPRDTDLEYARFGLTLEHIGEQTWKNPERDVKTYWCKAGDC